MIAQFMETLGALVDAFLPVFVVFAVAVAAALGVWVGGSDSDRVDHPREDWRTP